MSGIAIPPIVIVVGAGPEAERWHRPLAYELQAAIRHWQADHDCPGAPEPTTSTDLWYLNAPDLMVRPSIMIGDPAANAACAYHASRLPTALVLEETLRIHLDPEFITSHACVWGVDRRATELAVATFRERYLDAFLGACHGLRADPAGAD